MKKAGKGCFGCFGIIGIVVVLGILGVVFLFMGSDNKKSDTTESSVAVASSSSEETSESSSSAEKANDFKPTDSSDATIESIKTYDDYMTMYEFIVNEYITNYEAAVEQYGLGDDSGYQTMRDQVTASVEQQKAQYGAMGNAKIIGKEELVTFLKEYRDELKTFTDQMAQGL